MKLGVCTPPPDILSTRTPLPQQQQPRPRPRPPATGTIPDLSVPLSSTPIRIYTERFILHHTAVDDTERTFVLTLLSQKTETAAPSSERDCSAHHRHGVRVVCLLGLCMCHEDSRRAFVVLRFNAHPAVASLAKPILQREIGSSVHAVSSFD